MTVLYKYAHFLKASDDPAFDALSEPGSMARWSGIYRCEACGVSITTKKGLQLPMQTHHRHESYEGRIRWRLVVGPS